MWKPVCLAVLFFFADMMKSIKCFFFFFCWALVKIFSLCVFSLFKENVCSMYIYLYLGKKKIKELQEISKRKVVQMFA